MIFYYDRLEKATKNAPEIVATALVRVIVTGPLQNTQQTQNNNFVQHLHNVGPTLKTLGGRCTNVMHMYCVCWVVLPS